MGRILIIFILLFPACSFSAQTTVFEGAIPANDVRACLSCAKIATPVKSNELDPLKILFVADKRVFESLRDDYYVTKLQEGVSVSDEDRNSYAKNKINQFADDVISAFTQAIMESSAVGAPKLKIERAYVHIMDEWFPYVKDDYVSPALYLITDYLEGALNPEQNNILKGIQGLKSNNPNYLEIKNLREMYKADLVVGITQPPSNSKGLPGVAWQTPDASHAVAIVSLGRLDVALHELGHLTGMEHNAASDIRVGDYRDLLSNTADIFAGKLYTKETFHTLMAPSETIERRFNVYSNESSTTGVLFKGNRYRTGGIGRNNIGYFWANAGSFTRFMMETNYVAPTDAENSLFSISSHTITPNDNSICFKCNDDSIKIEELEVRIYNTLGQLCAQTTSGGGVSIEKNSSSECPYKIAIAQKLPTANYFMVVDIKASTRNVRGFLNRQLKARLQITN